MRVPGGLSIRHDYIEFHPIRKIYGFLCGMHDPTLLVLTPVINISIRLLFKAKSDTKASIM